MGRTLHHEAVRFEGERFSDEVVPFDKDKWPLQIHEPVHGDDMSGGRIPDSIVLSLRDTLTSQAQTGKYTLAVTSLAALANVKAGVYPSGFPADFLRKDLLSKI